MANCIDCKVSVGCSCQLTKGRCSACNYKYQQSLLEPVKKLNNANPQIKELR